MVLECCFNKCLRYYFGIKCFLELVYVPCFALMRTPCRGGFRQGGGGGGGPLLNFGFWGAPWCGGFGQGGGGDSCSIFGFSGN